MDLDKRIPVSLGDFLADLVIKNAWVLNVFTEQWEQTDVAISQGTVVGLGVYSGARELDARGMYLVPGFIDAHMHLESSIVSPSQYARAVVPHGTTAVIADPHEICNVLGIDGFHYMLEETRDLPMDAYFMVPSCVPATPFDESGAVLTAQEVRSLLQEERVLGLGEMMNYPGVLNRDPGVLEKIQATLSLGKRVDGHAPGLSGAQLNAYLSAGISTDHECSNAQEAQEKISRGQWIMIREGTAGKNLQDLLPLFAEPWCRRCMLATDDKHPGELHREGHIDHILRKAIAAGADPIKALKMASYNTAQHFGLTGLGAIAPGCRADLVLLEELETVKVHTVLKNGLAFHQLPPRRENPYGRTARDSVHIPMLSAGDFQPRQPRKKLIGLVPGQLLTTDQGWAETCSPEVCRLAVVERHKGTGHIGHAWLKGYGLTRGAVATTVAHDSHNIIIAGVSPEDMALAANRLWELRGGMVVVENGRILEELPLPIAGLMCDLDVAAADERLEKVRGAARSLGVGEEIDPFMTLSFVSLPVIPSLRLTTLGVVDVDRFCLVE